MDLFKMDSNNCSAIILAGGESTRMGFPKLWLRNEGGSSFVEKLVNAYANWGCEKIIVVINKNYVQKPWTTQIKELAKKANIIVNTQPQKGRFYSLKLAVKQLRKTDSLFIQNVDNPFINYELLELLYANQMETGYTVPCFEGKGGHPILLNSEIIKHIGQLKEYTLNLREVLEKFTRKNAEVIWPQVLYNINTQDKYDEYRNTSLKNMSY